MPQQIINVSTPNDGLGDPIYNAFRKVNDNFTELYGGVTGGKVPNVYYVSTLGTDDPDRDSKVNGQSLSESFATISRAVEIANAWITANPGTRVTIFVKAGEYLEQNPISCSPGITIVGDDLRSVSVRPINKNLDIFHVRNACYITGMTFRGHESPAAAIAYPPDGAGLITTSPYIQNCSSITTTGCGMRIDGLLAAGLKSMVTDSFTQVNEGGIGIHILNQAYAQLVSVFTICTNIGILVESGGLCSITNSNSSFGTFGLVSRGKITLSNTGQVNGANQLGQALALRGLTAQPASDQSISFDNGITFNNILEATPLDNGESVVVLGNSISIPYADNTPVTFYKRSTITASGHTFEWIGTGDVLINALPQTGAMPIRANEVIQDDGGQVIYTSTDQRGDFRIGDQLTINGASGTITGTTFDKALFAVITPYVLAIEG